MDKAERYGSAAAAAAEGNIEPDNPKGDGGGKTPGSNPAYPGNPGGNPPRGGGPMELVGVVVVAVVGLEEVEDVLG